jgi:hypothetical protein
MRRLGGWRIAALAVGVAAAAAAAVLILVAVGWDDGSGGSYAPTETLVQTRLDPPSALFGDAVTATAVVLVDRRDVDPGTVSLVASFRPFQSFASERTVTDDVGHATRVTFTNRLQCVTGACLRAMETEEQGGRLRTVPIAFRKATVKATGTDGRPVSLTASWPTLVVHSRLTAEDIDAGIPTAPASPPPAVTYATAPDRLGWILAGIAAALLLAAGALAASVLWASQREKQLRLPAHLTPAQRSLALARHALDRGDVAGARKALERLAAELDRGGRDDLAQAADRLAWSSSEPSPEALDELALSVEGSANGR